MSPIPLIQPSSMAGQSPIGHEAGASVVFRGMKHPQTPQVLVASEKLSQERQKSILVFRSRRVTRGTDGLNKSEKETSSLMLKV